MSEHVHDLELVDAEKDIRVCRECGLQVAVGEVQLTGEGAI